MNILFIDNFDSFTYNLVDEFEKRSCNVIVYRNDTEMEKIVKVIGTFRPKLIVISPGPSNPKNAGICLDVIMKYSGNIPIFGVCLGHQCIIEAFGGAVVRCSEARHGKPSLVYHQETGIFKDIENPFQAGRYHSLAGKEISDELVITAKTADGIIMGIKHINHITFGVQFHPESILTPLGGKIIDNCLEVIL